MSGNAHVQSCRNTSPLPVNSFIFALSQMEGAESGIRLQPMGPTREDGDGCAAPMQETGGSSKIEYPMTYAAISKSSDSGEKTISMV